MTGSDLHDRTRTVQLGIEHLKSTIDFEIGDGKGWVSHFTQP